MNTKGGTFITVDGPNGVGKTTVVLLACAYLRALGWSVLQTREPTSAFNRANEEKHGSELARLIVEDRRHHLASEIEPALQQSMCVVCDRYIESSLVYRKLDGIPFEYTWQENSSFRVPDMSILLTASAATLEDRLKNKEILSRFEREHTPKEELLLYKGAHQFLGKYGFRSVIVENDKTAPEITAKHIADLIMQLKEG